MKIVYEIYRGKKMYPGYTSSELSKEVALVFVSSGKEE